jgi:hypothetical protein
MIELDRSQECIEAGVIAARKTSPELKDKILEQYIGNISKKR